MKTVNLIFILFIFIISSCSNTSKTKVGNTEFINLQKNNEKYSLLWQTDTLLTTVESVKFDAVSNCLYAACINGKPSEKDSNGFISKLDLNGKILKLKWCNGLDAPKGMGILNNHLFVTNIDQIVEINIQTSKIINRYKVNNAKFLNDIDVDSIQNIVFVSDMATGIIYQLQNEKISILSQDTSLQKCNGLYFLKNELFVGTQSGVKRININTASVSSYIIHLGGIDGLEWFSKDKFLVSNWSGEVDMINPESDKLIIFDTTSKGINAADIEYIPEKKMLLVPTFFDNRVMAYRLNIKQ